MHDARKPYVAGFQEDVFLSYSSIDNLEGWVTDLHTLLDIRLRGLLGPNVRTWRDPRLHEGDALWETLESTISGSALFIAILSPSYVQSAACRREARHFYGQASSRDLLVGTTCRLIQVVKTPFEHHPESRFLEGIESIQSRFFDVDTSDNDNVRFTAFSSRVGSSRYYKFDSKLDDLAQSLAGILQKMHSKFIETEPKNSRLSIFLASSTADCKQDHAFVTQEIGDLCELQSPENLPLSLKELTEGLSQELSGCALSVHLLGSSFGIVPEGEAVRSLPWIQFAAGAVTRRLVWIPEDLTGVDPRQQLFIAEVEACRDPHLEVARQGLPDFVQYLKDVVRKLSRSPGLSVFGKAIYVVSDARDLSRQELKQLRNCILSQGFRIEDPVFEDDDENLRLAEERALRDSNAVLLYWGDAPDSWVKTRREKIRKTLATLKYGAQYRRALYLSSPEKSAKEMFKDLPEGLFPEEFGPPLLVLGDCSNFDCGKLDLLLRTIKGSES